MKTLFTSIYVLVLLAFASETAYLCLRAPDSSFGFGFLTLVWMMGFPYFVLLPMLVHEISDEDKEYNEDDYDD